MRSGTDEELYRINPIQFATEKSIVEAEAIDLFLHACVAGLFDMDWMPASFARCVLTSWTASEACAKCTRISTATFCQSDYDASPLPVDDYITVTFTVSPAVRGIRFP